MSSSLRSDWWHPAGVYYLPGGAFTLGFSSGAVIQHQDISALHGIVTSLTGAHARHVPKFSLFPWKASSCGWAVYVDDLEVAHKLAGRSHGVLYDGKTQIVCGPLTQIKTPLVPAGLSTVYVTTRTPLFLRGSNRQYPTVQALTGTLSHILPSRLGGSVNVEALRVYHLECGGDFVTTDLQGNGVKLNGAFGWSGVIKVDINEVGRWLLECAARGLGLGGRVAFGFGSIALSRT